MIKNIGFCAGMARGTGFTNARMESVKIVNDTSHGPLSAGDIIINKKNQDTFLVSKVDKEKTTLYPIVTTPIIIANRDLKKDYTKDRYLGVVTTTEPPPDFVKLNPPNPELNTGINEDIPARKKVIK